MRLALVCDVCGVPLKELASVPYSPRGRTAVGQLAELTARELGLAERRIARVRLAALISDVGRSQIPPTILNKRGPLTREEWSEVRRQPELGAALLSDASFDDIRDWVVSRRERVDGTGYPKGLRGGQIPVEARVLAVAEAYVAMTSERPHAAELDSEDALTELATCAGAQFDAAVVAAFIRSVRRESRRGDCGAAGCLTRPNPGPGMSELSEVVAPYRECREATGHAPARR